MRLTSVCCISNVLPIAGTDEELDLGEECLKVRDVWHGELHKSGAKAEGRKEGGLAKTLHSFANF